MVYLALGVVWEGEEFRKEQKNREKEHFARNTKARKEVTGIQHN